MWKMSPARNVMHASKMHWPLFPVLRLSIIYVRWRMKQKYFSCQTMLSLLNRLRKVSPRSRLALLTSIGYAGIMYRGDLASTSTANRARNTVSLNEVSARERWMLVIYPWLLVVVAWGSILFAFATGYASLIDHDYLLRT